MNALLLIHVFGSVLFLGNIITAAFWKVRADIKKQPLVIHQTVKSLMLADYVFTIPGIILIVISGAMMAARAAIPLHGFNWLTLSLLLFAITGVIWLAILIPMQRALIRHSAACIDTGHISEDYKRISRWYAAVGIMVTLLPVVVLYLMISKSF